tara:strand:+ start:182 stop:349 length:168 start_codon:yes stop_codon:yes gene_type:complete
MKNLEISLREKEFSGLLKDNNKISCNKCGGSGNIKSPENIRKTCLNCFGRGYNLS